MMRKMGVRIFVLCFLIGSTGASAQVTEPATLPENDSPSAGRPQEEVLTRPAQLARDRSIEKALAWLASRQREDGSFLAQDIAQPGVTSLCVLAYLSCGHTPDGKPYGDRISRAIDYILSCRQDDGLLAKVQTPPHFGLHTAAHTNIYNHAISSLALSEVYGMTRAEQARRIRQALEQAVEFTLARQQERKPQVEDQGGWRYLRRWYYRDADMSVTGWQLMSLRSARNSGIEIPPEAPAEALEFIQRLYDPQRQCFIYELSPDGNHPTRGMVGAGILSLSLAGKHDTPMARDAAKWLLRHDFNAYNRQMIDPRTGQESTSRDRYHYGAYYCSQAMFQLGGKYWQAFYPPLVDTFVKHQNADGSWQAEAGEDHRYGNTYTTALVVLAMTPPYELLPIFQR
jgi:hypothetical protein